MRTLVWRSVRNNTGRYIATLVAIVTGVAFFAATGFISNRVVSSLEGDVNRQYGDVDVAITPRPVRNGTAQASTTGARNGAELRISGATYDRLRAAPGVAGSAGELSAPVAIRGKSGAKPDPATGRLWITDKSLNPLELRSGRGPGRAGEVAVDRGLAEDRGLKIGSRLPIVTSGGAFDARVVGITSFGDSDAQDRDGTVSIPASTAFDLLNSGKVAYESVYLRGSDPSRLRDAAARLLPNGFRAQTGDAFRADQRDQIGAVGQVLRQGLQGFAILALLVGAFVIYNTFSVIIAQRMRELAVLSAVGATPKQIKRSLRWEGFTIGLIGAVLGVVVGVVLTALLLGVLGLLGADLPGTGLGLSAQSIWLGILLGTGITLLSVTLPARRAARVEPIEALRSASVETTSFSVKRRLIPAVMVAFGLLGLLAGGSAAVIALAAVVFFVGVIAAGPFFAVNGARIARPLMSRFGLEGRLAVDNTARNPARTATTANALLIGVFLVTLVTVAGESVKDFAVGEINRLSSADYVVTSQGGAIDSALAEQLRGIDGVESLVTFRRAAVTIGSERLPVSSGRLADVRRIADVDVDAGSLDDLGPGTIALLDDPAFPSRIGAMVSARGSTGEPRRLRLVARLKTSIDAAQLGGLVDGATLTALGGGNRPTFGFIDLASGTQTQAKKAIEARADRRPDITITEGNALGRVVGQVFDFVIKAVNGLLLMSVVVALIGIVNTLSLSILERRRELGLLRVVGMTDARVQRMIRLESVVIAGLGTILGLALGLFGAWATVFSIDRLSAADIGLRFPVVQLLVVLVVGLGLGLLASIIPARRSTRVEVLTAINA